LDKKVSYCKHSVRQHSSMLNGELTQWPVGSQNFWPRCSALRSAGVLDL